MSKPEIIDIYVKSVGREGRKVKLDWHQKDKRFLISTTGKDVTVDESNISEVEFDFLDAILKMNALGCKQRDLISFTLIVSETVDGQEVERRGMTTIIHII
jgi:hypothetical protein